MALGDDDLADLRAHGQDVFDRVACGACHSGAAKTLADVIPVMLRAAAPAGKPPPTLSDDDETALVEYLRGL